MRGDRVLLSPHPPTPQLNHPPQQKNGQNILLMINIIKVAARSHCDTFWIFISNIPQANCPSTSRNRVNQHLRCQSGTPFGFCQRPVQSLVIRRSGSLAWPAPLHVQMWCGWAMHAWIMVCGASLWDAMRLTVQDWLQVITGDYTVDCND